MTFEDLTMADLRRLIAALVAAGGDDMVIKLIERTPHESIPHGRVTMGTIVNLLEQTNGSTVLPAEVAAVLRVLATADLADREAIIRMLQLVTEPAAAPDDGGFYDDGDEVIDDPADEPMDDPFDGELPELPFDDDPPPPLPEPEADPLFGEKPYGLPFFEKSFRERLLKRMKPDIIPTGDLDTPEPLPRVGHNINDWFTDLERQAKAARAARLNPYRLPERLRRFMGGQPTILDSKLLAGMGQQIGLVIAYDRPLMDRIHAAGFAGIALSTISGRLDNPTVNPRQTPIVATVVSLHEPLDDAAIQRELDRFGYRHATLDELVAFAHATAHTHYRRLLAMVATRTGANILAVGTNLRPGSPAGNIVPCMHVDGKQNKTLTSNVYGQGRHAPIRPAGTTFLVVKTK